MELTDQDREELGRLIYEGYTNGIIDSEDSDGIPYRISWSISTEKFRTDCDD